MLRIWVIACRTSGTLHVSHLVNCIPAFLTSGSLHDAHLNDACFTSDPLCVSHLGSGLLHTYIPHVWYTACLTSGPHLVHYKSHIWFTAFLHTSQLEHHILTSGTIHVSHLVQFMSHIWYNSCFTSGTIHVSNLVH